MSGALHGQYTLFDAVLDAPSPPAPTKFEGGPK